MSGNFSRTHPRQADLSQHFLRESTAERLVQAMPIAPSDFVVEIGAGRGALTNPLVARSARVHANEIDPFLVDKLRHRFGASVDVLAGDFLSLPLPGHPYKVVGNVPFSRSTQIVRKLVGDLNPPDDAWLIVQREFAWRTCGRPYVPETHWSLRLKPRWHAEIIDRLRRTDFDPPPSVDSVLLWLGRRVRPLLADREAFLYGQLLDSALHSGGGTVRQGLRTWLSKVQLLRLSRNLNFDMDGRLSDLVFEQWLGILRFLQSQRTDRGRGSSPPRPGADPDHGGKDAAGGW